MAILSIGVRIASLVGYMLVFALADLMEEGLDSSSDVAADIRSACSTRAGYPWQYMGRDAMATDGWQELLDRAARAPLQSRTSDNRK